MRTWIAALALALIGIEAASADVLYAPEGNRLRRYDIESIKNPPLRQDVLIDRASAGGRDVNGPVCPLPDGSGDFVMGEDTGQPTIPPGWGVFKADGTQVGKLTATYFVQPQGDPFGCAFDHQQHLFTSEIGNSASGPPNGQLIMWFGPYEVYPGAPGTYPNTDASTNFCKIAQNIGTAGSVAVDEQGRVYVASSRGGGAAASAGILRYSGNFPTSPDAAGGCGRIDALGSPLVDEGRVSVELFIANSNVPTPNGIARAPNGNWYVASVLNGVIAEFDPNGTFIRRVLSPPRSGLPSPTGNPLGIAVDREGNLFFADLQLRLGPNGIGPGPNGKVRWISFDSQGTPAPPVIVRENLAFPDGLGVLAGTVAGCTDDCPDTCPGDCNGSRTVTVDEVVTGVNIALGAAAIDACDVLDLDEDGAVTVSELVSAVSALLNGCVA
jgi:sugar lactone lactonase YvrE